MWSFRRTLIAGVALGAVLAGTVPTPAGAVPTAGCHLGALDPSGLVAAVGTIPDQKLTTTSVHLRVTTPAGCFNDTFGVRDLRSAAPVPPYARFRIGSVTKVFTAVVVYQLVAEGQLDRLLAPAQQRELFSHPWAGAELSNGGLSSVRLPDGRIFWGKSGARYGYQALIGGIGNGDLRVAFAATPTDAKADGQSALAQRLLGAILALT
ncbi:serine hydrolase domain-containing protein [Micromonospora sp. NPDC047134]|uniref:serine hydrolase domain-containing protein n=1 Tax=Micromonospora sp. NPDC047134 TaxID=3154340 RepID=UPI0033D73638